MIRLFWAKCNNFGDELSPYIIKKLSGKTVSYRRNFSFEKYYKDVLRFFKSILIRRKIEVDCLKYSFFNKVILAVGSVINESTNQCVVWGSGIISQKTIIKGGVFTAVRGDETKRRLEELGFKAPEAVGDPALLMPILYYPKVEKRNEYTIGIIPHKIDFEDIHNKYASCKNLNIIDLQTSDVEFVINQVLFCDIVLSTSLHGVIVAHAYGVPALHFSLNKLLGDGTKFKDYYSSVGIVNYTPLRIEDVDISNTKILRKIFDNNKNHSLPNKDLLKRNQKKLIEVAPFYVKEKFKNYK